MKRRIGILALGLPLITVFLRPAAAAPLNRPRDPVVVKGSAVPKLNGIAPGLVVAFRYEGGWTQVPVQVDERKTVSFGQIYKNTGVYTYTGTIKTYVDPNTWTGADDKPNVDNNDEIVFMAKDAGKAAPAGSEPAGVVHGTGEQVKAKDPLSTGAKRYVYLFRQNGTLDQAAGANYVTYNFNLTSGDYKATYNIAAGPNPETSTVSSARYSLAFHDRWLSDELSITAGGATDVDILDRRKALFAPGQCVRSEDTFDAGEGAFIVNKDGPVRAIRAYLGANSGPYTQRTHLFYEGREDVVTDLRVHTISSVMDLFDYSPAASGMTYANSANLAGATVDGNPNPDSISSTFGMWERVSGAQGGLAIAHTLSTNLSITPTHYYNDDSTPSNMQCTGDAFEYGQSGPYINQQILCTDPSQGCTNSLESTRTLYYEDPTLDNALAATRYSQATTPLTTTVTSW
jgi:hypothetical protein